MVIRQTVVMPSSSGKYVHFRGRIWSPSISGCVDHASPNVVSRISRQAGAAGATGATGAGAGAACRI